ncbi:hypothetical protein C8R45DRAFT_1025944 [Mycena sanguinolenta]|nr:hypothetical protein C8R45DRAFT_1025944 [Mycena sanguinolenta]
MFLDGSPFVNRLNTNYIPSDSEALEISALLLDPEDELARIDARIEELEITLQQLKEQRASFKAPIDAHRALISPMRRIPHDVLLEIFCACLPSEHNALIDSAEAPLVLGRICKHWRSIAYLTPILWSTIHIPSLNYTHTPSKICSRLETIVEEWLKRSAICPLSVSFFDYTNHFPDFDKHPLVLQLLPFCQRLRHLTLNGDPEFLRPLLQLGSEDLPLLESLAVNCNALATVFANSQSAFNLSTLTNVAIRMMAPVDPHSLPLRWGQLTKLRLECDPVWTGQSTEGGLDLEGAFKVLRRCPMLVDCEFRITLGSGDADLILDTSPINLPQLRTLVLKGHIFFKKWIPYLVVPNLRSLQMGEVYRDRHGKDTLPRDACMSITVDVGMFTPSGVEDLFRSFPLVSHLQLSPTYSGRDASVDEELLGSLGSPHNLCPNLTSVAILSPNPSISDATFLTFVKARMALPTPLQRIQIQFRRPMELDIMPELQPYTTDGLQVDIEYPRPEPHFNAWEGLPDMRRRRPLRLKVTR